eukprot:scaffold30017_cov48-Cyclotella_meneghiniana.AAC.2
MSRIDNMSNLADYGMATIDDRLCLPLAPCHLPRFYFLQSSTSRSRVREPLPTRGDIILPPQPCLKRDLKRG